MMSKKYPNNYRNYRYATKEEDKIIPCGFVTLEKVMEFKRKLRDLAREVFGEGFTDNGGYILALVDETRITEIKDEVVLQRQYITSYDVNHCPHCRDIVNICLQDMKDTLDMKVERN